MVLINALDLCEGVTTRVDPRDGTGTSIDYALCNQSFSSKIIEMKIDEEAKFRPTNYASVIKQTDHNTITIKAKIERCRGVKPIP